MKKIKQTNLNYGTGNCWTACISSITEIPLEEIPNFCLHSDWLQRTIDWLRERNYGIIYIQDYKSYVGQIPFLSDNTFCIIGGGSPRNFEGTTDPIHAVIGICKKVENNIGFITEIEFYHDPHPSNDFLTDIRDITWLLKK